MSLVFGSVLLAIAVWATFASVRTIRRIGVRRFSLAVGRLGWDLVKVALGGTALVGGAVVASAAGRAVDDDVDSGLIGPDLMDGNDPDNYYLRPESPWYSGDYFDDKKEGEV